MAANKCVRLRPELDHLANEYLPHSDAIARPALRRRAAIDFLVVTKLRERSENKRPPRRLRFYRVNSLRGFKTWLWWQRLQQPRLRKLEAELRERPLPFSIPGFCYVCGQYSKFYVDALNAERKETKLVPNFRERALCKKCLLNTRMRASIHLFEEECRPPHGASIYLAEQVTPLYQHLRARFPQIVGSEYLGREIPFGAKTHDGVRNESLAALTFADATFDFILSFDVFEHIPEFERAFIECARCLKPGGRMVFSVPFVSGSTKNILRARVHGNGEVEHLLPPEFHADMLHQAGCLCFHHFGWEMLGILRKVGFARAYACLFRSRDFVYLGNPHPLFVAERAG
jgi:SAM-dependent methyltransferase